MSVADGKSLAQLLLALCMSLLASGQPTSADDPESSSPESSSPESSSPESSSPESSSPESSSPESSSTGLAIPPQVRQVLKHNCVKCHGVAKREGELQLHTPLRIWRGGQSGKAVVAGRPEASLLWQLVAKDEMPPGQPLSARDKQLLHDWIADGASGLPVDDDAAERMTKDEHWAFTKLHPAEVPTVKRPEFCRTPVDRFLEAELESAGLTLGDETDRHTLIRRVSYALTGLPPTPEAIERFVGDSRSDAYESMVERYLSSAQYAIRWGRHWLDAAGYADSNGYFNADSDRPLAYQYRDYVVRSIGADQAFDQFIRAQLAGDELSGFLPERDGRNATPEMIDMLTATHYLRNGQDGSGESDGNADEVRIDRYTALESAQHIIASSLLGLTFQCAKCHDHKFEPLTQLDFYRFQSVLYPAYNPDHWVKPNERVTQASPAGAWEQWQSELDATAKQLADSQSEYRDWARRNRVPALVRFADDFTWPDQIAERWTGTIPGDDGPAGTAAVTLRSGEADRASTLPAARVAEGHLQIIEGGASGDKWLSTRQTFDWTPDEQDAWIQVTFTLVDDKVQAQEAPAARIGYGIALHDFDNNSSIPGGNLLVDGNPAGGAAVHLDYPATSARHLGNIGSTGYVRGRSFGVRVTRAQEGKYRLQHIVDALPEGAHIDLEERDLPDGSFGFEYCCGRSFQVDDVVIEASYPASAARLSQQASAEATSAEATAAALAAYQAELERRRAEMGLLEARKNELQAQEPGRIAWVTDSTPEPPDVFLLARGEYSQPTEKVLPAPISALSDDDNPLEVRPPDAGVRSSGRRSAWARWVTRPGSRAASLMARVQVNRVWQHHFGVGIVSTSENLGMSGSEPTHAALLDYLAGEFIRSGWSLKSLHRLILHSAVSRQSSLAGDAGLKADPYNQLYWRYPLRRLDAEAIRDSHLSISGDLDRTLGGPYVPTMRNGAAEVIVPEDHPGAHRRSIYLQQRRTQGLSLLGVFDAPTMVINCTRRPVTTMPLQSLSLLNSEFAVTRAHSFAARIARDAGQSSGARIQRAFLLATGKACSEAELAGAIEFVQTQQQLYAQQSDAEDKAWSDLCQLLLASNACLYVE